MKPKARNGEAALGITEASPGRRSTRMNPAIVYILIAVTASAAGQILLKRGMLGIGTLTLTLDQLGSILWRLATNPYVIIGLAIYVCGTVFWLAALSRMDLSYAYPFASLGYLIMLAASWLLLKENITVGRLLGTMVVGLGVFLVSRS
jgi:drug/metabolite transporter (DMT)-like permease